MSATVLMDRFDDVSRTAGTVHVCLHLIKKNKIDH